MREGVTALSQVAAGIEAGAGHASPSPGIATATRRWRLVDRLGERVIDELLRDRRQGATQRELADRYDIGLSSVKRILREGSR